MPWTFTPTKWSNVTCFGITLICILLHAWAKCIQYGSGSGHPPPSEMYSTCIRCSTNYILNDQSDFPLFHEIFLASLNVLLWTFTPYQMVKCNMFWHYPYLHTALCLGHMPPSKMYSIYVYESGSWHLWHSETQLVMGLGHPPSEMYSIWISLYIRNNIVDSGHPPAEMYSTCMDQAEPSSKKCIQ